MTVTRRVLCLCGSLRRVSSNRAALEAARELARLDARLPLDTPSPQRKLGPSDFDDAEPEALDSRFRGNDGQWGGHLPSPFRPDTPSPQRKLGPSDFGDAEPEALDSRLRGNDERVVLDLQPYDGLGHLPPFNPDDEHDPLPSSVRALREAVGQADALLVACPEYAHGVPGAFKNLLDWLVGSLEFPGKPVLLLNASARGSHHAQEALAEILRTMSAELLSAQPFPVALPGAGCMAEQVLASAERCAELRAALEWLISALPANG